MNTNANFHSLGLQALSKPFKVISGMEYRYRWQSSQTVFSIICNKFGYLKKPNKKRKKHPQ